MNQEAAFCSWKPYYPLSVKAERWAELHEWSTSRQGTWFGPHKSTGWQYERSFGILRLYPRNWTEPLVCSWLEDKLYFTGWIIRSRIPRERILQFHFVTARAVFAALLTSTAYLTLKREVLCIHWRTTDFFLLIAPNFREWSLKCPVGLNDGSLIAVIRPHLQQQRWSSSPSWPTR